MGVNKVDFGGNTLIDLTGDTLESAEQLLKGIIAHAKDGSVITGLMEAIEAGGAEIATGSFTNISSNQTSVKIEHGLGAIPKIVLVLWDDVSLDSITNTNYYIGGFVYQDGEFNDSVKMLSVNMVFLDTYTSFLYCSKINDVVHYNGFDIRSDSPYQYCSIYDVNENTFRVNTRLNRMTKPSIWYTFAVGGTYKWIAI